jgi:signal transduction histidine kinase
MGAGTSPISAILTGVSAGGDLSVGNTTNHYYASANRPSGLHVGVPPMPAHFFGREPLVAHVAQRLVSGSLALSTEGLPGVGKTTLAVALAYRREVLDHFTDGVLWGALGVQPDEMKVLASWAAALAIDVSSTATIRERAERVRDAIGQRRLLLVIDDVWEPERAMLLRCGGPNCAHFLTTRNQSTARAFAGSQGTVTINELEHVDALSLLQTLAPEACAADPASAVRLVAAVGYLPLAIELMGSYLAEAENRYFREQQHAALRRIADPAERLRQTCKRLGNNNDAQITLKEAIQLSLHDLSDDAVTAFHALGAFAPTPERFDMEAAIAVTGASAGALSRLLERHLLEQQDGALSLHQMIADVARSATNIDAENAHRDYYLACLTQNPSDRSAVKKIIGQLLWSLRGNQSLLHDMHNLLNIVVMHEHLLYEGLIDEHRLTEITKGQTNYLRMAIANMVELHKLDSGTLELALVDVSVPETVSEVCEWYVGFAARRKRYVINLLAERHDFHVLADAMHLKRIISNLIDNAVKYIPTESTVSVDAVDEGEIIDIRVSDTGQGIPEKHLSRIFDFWESGENKRAVGLGLGLPSSRLIAELMHGTLEVESTADVGTTFHLRLPKAVSHHASDVDNLDN